MVIDLRMTKLRQDRGHKVVNFVKEEDIEFAKTSEVTDFIIGPPRGSEKSNRSRYYEPHRIPIEVGSIPVETNAKRIDSSKITN